MLEHSHNCNDDCPGGGFESDVDWYCECNCHLPKSNSNGKPAKQRIDEICTLDTLWYEIVAFNDKYFPHWREQDLRFISNALAGETGELCDKTKHFYYGGTNQEAIKEVTPETMVEEDFDIFVYLILFIGAVKGMASDAKADRRFFLRYGKQKLKLLYERMGEKLD